jgi:exodeoxyribonuclease VII large subunit
VSSTARSFASVSRVQARIRKLLAPALEAAPFWLRAELSSVSRARNGALYCDLVEMEGGRIVAKLRCIIWPRDLGLIERRLREARLDELLEDGNEVGLRVGIQYHDLYGLSVQAVDIDPSVSLGELERKRQEIIGRLRAEGLLDRNAERPLCALPQRIGLVASRGTAGYKDFVSTIERSGYSMRIFAADARVEGEATERSVLEALDCLARLDLDLVVVLRGGGSRVSLSYLDNEAIARTIANYPHPVWTGIGHEIDTSVLDAVAHRSFKTPTAVAEELVSIYVEADERLREAVQRLRAAATMRLRPERDFLDAADERLMSYARRALRERRNANAADATEFRLLVERRLTAEKSHLDRWSTHLGGLARERSRVARRGLDEHRKSLHKTIGRALERRRERRVMLLERLRSPAVRNRLRGEEQRLDAWGRVLRAMDPQRALDRGYALVYAKDGALLRDAGRLVVGQRVRTRLAGGEFESTVESIEPGGGETT